MSHIPTRGNCQNLTFTKLQKFLPTHPWQPITTIWTFKGVDLFKPEWRIIRPGTKMKTELKFYSGEALV